MFDAYWCVSVSDSLLASLLKLFLWTVNVENVYDFDFFFLFSKKPNETLYNNELYYFCILVNNTLHEFLIKVNNILVKRNKKKITISLLTNLYSVYFIYRVNKIIWKFKLYLQWYNIGNYLENYKNKNVLKRT